MSKEALAEIDKQIISWVEELDKLYKERDDISMRINLIELRLSTLKNARASLAFEWGEETAQVPIPLQYICKGVTDAIHAVVTQNKLVSVDDVVWELKKYKYDFSNRNPRRVVNMALVNDPEMISDGTGKYKYVPEPF